MILPTLFYIFKISLAILVPLPLHKIFESSCLYQQELLLRLVFKHFYWSIIALQWCVSFCFITSESAIHIHISPYLPPLASPSHPPYPTALGGHKAQSWSPCAMRLKKPQCMWFLACGGPQWTAGEWSAVWCSKPTSASVCSLCLRISRGGLLTTHSGKPCPFTAVVATIKYFLMLSPN